MACLVGDYSLWPSNWEECADLGAYCVALNRNSATENGRHLGAGGRGAPSALTNTGTTRQDVGSCFTNSPDIAMETMREGWGGADDDRGISNCRRQQKEEKGRAAEEEKEKVCRIG